jgi:hypothetical protein
MAEAGYYESWITYGNPYFAAKELTVLPGRSVTIQDAGPYGLIVLQGHGSMGRFPIERRPDPLWAAHARRIFVSCQAAQEGVAIQNPSKTDPIVMLKHFGPNPHSPDLPVTGAR